MLKRLFKLHIGLIKYVYAEIKQKRTVKQLLEFFKILGLRYIKIILEEYKSLFFLLDPQYRLQKAKNDRKKQLQKDLNRALTLLKHIDKRMEKQGLNRQRRRQFWRDFYSNGQLRTQMFNDLSKEIGG